eukprot:TRINITY_DN1425_c0_g1_i1.p2 TRINITY_DN1425_c0_g1~~TRINITY_DN1425_c0_g1_i1.p2  ORF type:complete len:718 (-),score=497.76 TRINITY_DN1425_c0_g1_i1:38-2191(-)
MLEWNLQTCRWSSRPQSTPTFVQPAKNTVLPRAQWQAQQQKYPGRLVVIFAQVAGPVGQPIFGGMLYGGVGGFASSRNRAFIWMNINKFGQNRAPWFDDRSFQHELGHAVGLFHTFQTAFGCERGDLIDDTPIAPRIIGGSCNVKASACDGVSKARDMQNLMSYGRCRGASHVTPLQHRRVRCAVENNVPWRLVSGRRAPAPAPSSPGRAPAPSALPRCRGGQCVDVRAANACGTSTVSGRCPGSWAIKCCLGGAGDVVVQHPAVGAPCLGAAVGVCRDTATDECAGSAFVAGACPGPADIQCCVAAGESAPDADADADGGTALLVADAGEQVRDADVVALPSAVYHVGATVTVATGVVLTRVQVYLVPSGALRRPSAGELGAPLPDSVVVDASTVAVPLVGVDRGDFMIVIVGDELDAAGGAVQQAGRQLVSDVFAVDVNSCALFGAAVPYGLVRSAAACTERSGRVARELGDGLVCCEPAPVRSGVQATELAQLELSDEAEAALGGVPTLESGVDAPLVELEWLGETSFWGARMQLTPLAAPAAGAVDLTLYESAAAPDATRTPETVFALAPDGALTPQQFTPLVSSPGVFVLATHDAGATSAPFSVVPLPCAVGTTGDAGYCLPVAPIAGGVGGATPSELTCAGGDLAPCTDLAVGAVQFACCPGTAYELQSAAVYREVEAVGQRTLAAADSAASLTAAVSLALALALAAAQQL